MAYIYKDPVLHIGFNQPRVLRWSRDDVRADSYDIEDAGDMVQVIWNDKKLFEGWLKENEVSVDQPERMRFYAVDNWGWLTRHILKIGGYIRMKYNAVDEGQTLKTCGEIIKDILDNANIPGWVCSGYSAGSLSGMTVQPPMVDWEGIYIADAINEVLRYQATYGMWIDPITKKMKFVDFESSMPEKSVYLGVLNQSIIDHSEYNIVKTDLRPTLRECVTKVIIEGEGIYEESEVTLEEDWDSNLEADWNWVKWYQQKDTYGKVFSCFKTPSSVDLPLLSMKIEDDGTVGSRVITAEIEYISDISGTTWIESEASVNPETGKIRFNVPVMDLRINNMQGKYRRLPEARSKNNVRMTLAQRTGNLRIEREDLSGAGTQANYTREKYIKDTNYYKLIKGGVAVRDDTSRMNAVGDKALVLNKDIKMEGMVTIDIGDEDVNWELGQKVAIKNSNKSAWATNYLRIVEIDYDLQRRECSLELTSNRSLFGESFMGSQRRLSKKVDEIERDVRTLSLLSGASRIKLLNEVPDKSTPAEGAETPTDVISSLVGTPQDDGTVIWDDSQEGIVSMGLGNTTPLIHLKGADGSDYVYHKDANGNWVMRTFDPDTLIYGEPLAMSIPSGTSEISMAWNEETGLYEGVRREDEYLYAFDTVDPRVIPEGDFLEHRQGLSDLSVVVHGGRSYSFWVGWCGASIIHPCLLYKDGLGVTRDAYCGGGWTGPRGAHVTYVPNPGVPSWWGWRCIWTATRDCGGPAWNGRLVMTAPSSLAWPSRINYCIAHPGVSKQSWGGIPFKLDDPIHSVFTRPDGQVQILCGHSS